MNDTTKDDSAEEFSSPDMPPAPASWSSPTTTFATPRLSFRFGRALTEEEIAVLHNLVAAPGLWFDDDEKLDLRSEVEELKRQLRDLQNGI